MTEAEYIRDKIIRMRSIRMSDRAIEIAMGWRPGQARVYESSLCPVAEPKPPVEKESKPQSVGARKVQLGKEWEEKALSLLKIGPLIGAEIAKGIGTRDGHASKIMKRLKAAGKVERIGEGKYSKWKLVEKSADTTKAFGTVNQNQKSFP